jgi:hypothetical protein
MKGGGHVSERRSFLCKLNKRPLTGAPSAVLNGRNWVAVAGEGECPAYTQTLAGPLKAPLLLLL